MKKLSFIVVLYAALVVISGCSVNSKKENAEIVAIQAFNKMYVTIPGDGGGAKLIASKSEVGEWEKFSMYKDEANLVSFKGNNNSFVCANLADWGILISDKRIASGWEKFMLVDLGKNQIALKTTYGKYITADATRKFQLVADKDSIGDSERFTLVKNP